MSAQPLLYAAASAVSLASYALHAFGGGALMARPFYQKASAGGVPTQAFRYCWHFLSAALIAMSAGYAFLVAFPQQWALGAFLTASAACFSALSIIIARIERSPALRSPPTTLFALIAVFGATAITAG